MSLGDRCAGPRTIRTHAVDDGDDKYASAVTVRRLIVSKRNADKFVVAEQRDKVRLGGVCRIVQKKTMSFDLEKWRAENRVAKKKKKNKNLYRPAPGVSELLLSSHDGGRRHTRGWVNVRRRRERVFSEVHRGSTTGGDDSRPCCWDVYRRRRPYRNVETFAMDAIRIL